MRIGEADLEEFAHRARQRRADAEAKGVIIGRRLRSDRTPRRRLDAETLAQHLDGSTRRRRKRQRRRFCDR
jgi:hypothetical protein